MPKRNFRASRKTDRRETKKGSKREPRTKTREVKMYERWVPATPLLPRNERQQDLINAVYSSPVTIAIGYPGTGKTYIPARIAGYLMATKQLSNIILTRPAVSDSASVGFFKGSKDEKMTPWLGPVLKGIKQEIAPSDLEYLMDDDIDRISFVPLEIVKGASWDDTIIIVDEAEDLTIVEVRALMTRLGRNSHIIFAGDLAQSNRRNPGIQILLDTMRVDDGIEKVATVINFDDKDHIVRSPECRDIVMFFDRQWAMMDTTP